MPVSAISSYFSNNMTDMGTLVVGDGAHKYKLMWDVVMASEAGPINVIVAGQGSTPNPLPAEYSPYAYVDDTDANSFAKIFSVVREPLVTGRYTVTVQYEPLEDGEMPDAAATPGTTARTPIKSVVNPILRKKVMWWDRQITSRIEKIDNARVTLRNPAGSLYEDIHEEDRAKAVLVVEWNVASINEFITFSRKYDQTVNSNSWTFNGAAYQARTALVHDISCSPLRTEAPVNSTTVYNYYTVAARIAFADTGSTWDVPMPEMGQHFYTKSGGGTYDLDGSFRKRTDAGFLVPLNEDGTRRSDDEQVLVKDWRIRRESDFNQLIT